jgi:hypothetical protein
VVAFLVRLRFGNAADLSKIIAEGKLRKREPS